MSKGPCVGTPLMDVMGGCSGFGNESWSVQEKAMGTASRPQYFAHERFLQFLWVTVVLQWQRVHYPVWNKPGQSRDWAWQKVLCVSSTAPEEDSMGPLQPK